MKMAEPAPGRFVRKGAPTVYFAEKLKLLRNNAHLTQEEVAAIVGVSYRTYQNYETGNKYPRKTDVYGRFAALFGVTADYLLSDEDQYLIDAQDKGGGKAMKDVQKIIMEVNGLFAGNELSDADKDKVLMAINEAYWDSKRRNKEKYTPKKYRKKQTQTNS